MASHVFLRCQKHSCRARASRTLSYPIVGYIHSREGHARRQRLDRARAGFDLAKCPGGGCFSGSGRVNRAARVPILNAPDDANPSLSDSGASARLLAAMDAQVAAGAPGAVVRIEAPRAGLLWAGSTGRL